MKDIRTWIIAVLSLTVLTLTLISHSPYQTPHHVASGTTTTISPDGPPPWEP